MFPLSCIVNHSHPISKRYSRSGPSPRQLSRVLYNNQINARSLIGQSAMVYCAINPWKKRASSELLYLTIRLRARVFYEQIVNEAQPS